MCPKMHMCFVFINVVSHSKFFSFVFEWCVVQPVTQNILSLKEYVSLVRRFVFHVVLQLIRYNYYVLILKIVLEFGI